MTLDERVVRQLAALIDSDEPPGMAANVLAQQVVMLVRDRSPITAIRITDYIEKLGERFPR